MPIKRISAEAAFAGLRKNRSAVWPDGRRNGERLEGVASPQVNPTFTFGKDSPILTFGSCFARNIEWHLVTLGFDLPMTRVSLPPEERVSDVTNDILNKYSIHAIENEIRWAFEGCDVPSEQLFLETEDGLWHDPQFSPNLIPASIDRIAERRELVLASVRELVDSSLVIITLGLAESWYDSLTGLYLNGAPPPPALKRSPGRFFIDILNYKEILDSLERTYALILKHGRSDVKVLVTTSPVPFKATFSGEDALVANCYSKSVQRAVCREFSARHDGVDYFPSYEVVTLTERPIAYEVDNIHVRPAVVSTIMDRVIAAYCPDIPGTVAPEITAPEYRPAKGRPMEQDLATALRFYKQGDLLEAIAQSKHNLMVHGAKMSSQIRGETLNQLGSASLRVGQPAAALTAFKQALSESPLNAKTNFNIGIAYSRLKKSRDAIVSFERASAIEPRNAEYLWRRGWELRRAGDEGAAVALFHEALKLDPGHPAAREALSQKAAA